MTTKYGGKGRGIDAKFLATNTLSDLDSRYILATAKAAASGVCDLDSSTLVPLTRLPSTLTGKDADTVDTLHASSFALLAGATFTGTVHIAPANDAMLVINSDTTAHSSYTIFQNAGANRFYLNSDSESTPVFSFYDYNYAANAMTYTQSASASTVGSWQFYGMTTITAVGSAHSWITIDNASTSYLSGIGLRVNGNVRMLLRAFNTYFDWYDGVYGNTPLVYTYGASAGVAGQWSFTASTGIGDFTINADSPRLKGTLNSCVFYIDSPTSKMTAWVFQQNDAIKWYEFLAGDLSYAAKYDQINGGKHVWWYTFSTMNMDLGHSNTSYTLTRNGNTVWDAGNGGTGSGLDADTVDGTHLSGVVLQGTVAGTTLGTKWTSGSPAFVAAQKYWAVVIGGVTYWIPLWSST